jgi:hypothetical protein
VLADAHSKKLELTTYMPKKAANGNAHYVAFLHMMLKIVEQELENRSNTYNNIFIKKQLYELKS